MTAGQHIVNNSTLLTGIAWDHLINPSGEGGGGIVINSERVVIIEEPIIKLVEYSDKVVIIEEQVVSIVEKDDVVTILDQEKEEIDVIC